MKHRRVVFAKMDLWPPDFIEEYPENVEMSPVRNEIWNFTPDELGPLRAFVRPAGGTKAARVIRVEKIDPLAKHQTSVEDVLVVFFAKPEPRMKGKGRQVRVVGWFDWAIVYKEPKTEVIRTINGKKRSYNLSGHVAEATLLPAIERTFAFKWEGQSWIHYPSPSMAREAIDFVELYAGQNLLKHPATNKIEVEPVKSASRYLADAKLRRAIEMYSVEKAKSYYEARGYAVRVEGKPFDLLCKHETTKSILIIEVKGTRNNPETEVVLTKNEVDQDFLSKFENAKAELFIVQGIKENPVGSSKVEGGVCKIVKNWKPEEHRLQASQYIYQLDLSKVEPA